MAVCSTGFVTAAVTSLASNGAISCSGLKVGDLLLGVWVANDNLFSGPGGALEAKVSVADEIQQIFLLYATGTPLILLLMRQ